MSDPTRYSAYDPNYASRLASMVTRPGLVTAIAVFSIIVGSFGVLGSIGTGMIGIKTYRLRQISVERSKNPVYLPPATPSAPGAMVGQGQTPSAVQSDGMELSDRQTFAGVVTQLESFEDARLKQFDAILASHGWKIFPLRNQVLTANRIGGAISSHGTFPSNNPKDPDPIYLTTSAGRLEIFLDRAVFRPGDGSAVIRSNLPDNKPIAGAASNTVTGVDAAEDTIPPGQGMAVPTAGQFNLPGYKLTSAEIEQAIFKAQQTASNKLNPAQLKALRAALSEPNQVLVQPGSFSPVSLAIVQADGSALIKFQQVYVMVDPSGHLETVGGTTLQAVAVRPLALSGLLSESLLAFVLAGMLIIAGILALKRVRLGYVMHIIYAITKIPVAIIGGLTLAWVISGCEASTIGGGGDSAAGAVWGSIIAGLGILYPFVLLMVLFTRTVRDYFRTEA